MRKLLWFTVGFTGACLILIYCGCGTIPMAAAAFFSCFVCFWGRKNQILRRAAAIALGFGAACLWYQIYSVNYLAPAYQLDGQTQEAQIVITDYSYDTGYGRTAVGTIQLEGKTYRVKVYLEEGETILPGTRAAGSFRFRLTTPDSEEGITAHSGKGLFLLLYGQEDVTLSQTQEDSAAIRVSRFRQKIRLALETLMPGDVYPFAKALLLGDTRELSYEVNTQLKVSGIRHVVAVSGLHISILFALLRTVTLRNRFTMAVVGIPMLALFAAIAEFTPSVSRACLMSGLMLVGQLMDREYDGMTSLSFAVLTMLLMNPLTVISVSFQLSVASVAGIFLFSEPIAQWMRNHMGSLKGKSISAKAKRWLATSVSITLSAMVTTTPVCAWNFGNVSLVGVLTNLLTLWVISFIFYGLLAANVLLLFWQSGAAWVARTSSWLIRYVLWIAGILSKIPVASLYTQSDYVVFWLVFVYLLMAVFALGKQKRARVFICCLGLSLSAALLLSFLESRLYGTCITVLDVGQGQCVLLQSEGKNYLVDCGGDDAGAAADTAAEYLLSRGISRLDGIVLTHMDKDHSAGVTNLLTRVDADVLVVPPVPLELDSGKTQILAADREVAFRWGNCELTVYGERLPGSNAENSICVLFDTEKCDILITGDRNFQGESRLMQKAQLPEVDVLIAGHHGSAYATSEELLDTVRPEIVCISVGKDNFYGHPAPQTLQRIQSRDCKIFRTDLNGTITIRR